MKRKPVIGITDCGPRYPYQDYERWILQELDITTIRLSHHEGNLDAVNRCDGVVLSGGEDIHPRFYNKPEYIEFCMDVDERRDEFELDVLRLVAGKKPLLGICRGLQIANVYFGGTLIPDLPAFGKYSHSRLGDRDREHEVSIDEYSTLRGIAGSTRGNVNSAHHQSAFSIGKNLVVNCFSPDGVIEGIEWRKPGENPFLMLVQWHPERMNDQSNPLSQNIRRAFMKAVQDFIITEKV